LKEGRSFFDFRPGMKLSDYMTVFLPRYKDADDQFIMASHADRLKQSKCFIKSMETVKDTGALRPYKNALTCVTCHNPHVSVRVTGKEIFNNACKNCHNTTTHNGLCNEKQSVRGKVFDNCVSCHMPNSGSIDIPHVTVHDHYIRKPIKKEEIEKVKKFIGLYAINEKAPADDVKAKAYIQQYDKFEYNPVLLDSAAKYLNVRTKEDLRKSFETVIHLYFIKQDYGKILSYVEQLGKENVLNSILVNRSWSNDNAWTLYRIGEAYYNNSDYLNAYAFYMKADQLAPFDPEFKNKLGASLMAQNKVTEAMKIFETTIQENPKFVPALNNLGYAQLVSNDPAKAAMFYDRALKLDPDYEPLLMNVAGLKIYEKNYKAAAEILKKVLKKNPKNKQAEQVLNQLTNLK
jgi:tetratricopeptide (TPR) repeat protein